MELTLIEYYVDIPMKKLDCVKKTQPLTIIITIAAKILFHDFVISTLKFRLEKSICVGIFSLVLL